MDNSNLYQRLQVDPCADPDVIDAAYKRLVRKYHPDVNRSTNATAQMHALNAAYAVLRDAAQRAAPRAAQTPPAAPPPPVAHAAPVPPVPPARPPTPAPPAPPRATTVASRDRRAFRRWQGMHIAGGALGAFLGLLGSIEVYAVLGITAWLVLFSAFIIVTYLVIRLYRHTAQRLAVYPVTPWIILARTLLTYVLYDHFFVFQNPRARIVLGIVAGIGACLGGIVSVTPARIISHHDRAPHTLGAADTPGAP